MAGYRKYIVSVAILWLLAVSDALAAAAVDNVRVWRSPEKTRIVLDLSSAAEHRAFGLASDSGYRWVFDLDNTKWSYNGPLDFSDSPIVQLRTGKQGNGTRVVIDLNEKLKMKSFALAPNGKSSHRLVIDVFDGGAKPVAQVVNRPATNRDVIIAIDAGHGGDDPGASGPNGLREKHVVLSIAKALAKKINATKGYKAQLIRTSDYYVPLRQRSAMARDMQADLFVSIHADAFTKPSAKGASVFALSTRGATSEMARHLARRENQSDVYGGVGGVDLTAQEEMVAKVLLDLSMDKTIEQSLQVGDYVLGNMGKMAHLHKKHVEQAAFVVLKSADVPSILVETGFISNPTEAKNLGSRRYREKMALAIFKGVDSYFKAQPPKGTWLASRYTGSVKQHRVGSGDTLSVIASRYQTSVSSIKRENNLRSDNIRVGQTLVIPSS